MSTIPPNNLDQLIAWIRLFAQENESQLLELKRSLAIAQLDIIEIKSKLLIEEEE